MKTIKRRIGRISSIFGMPSVQVGMILSAFLAALMAAVLLLERGTNADLATAFDAFWYTMVTITTIGYGDITPHTVAGKLVAVIIMLCGIVTFGAVSGQVASILFNRQRKKEKGLLTLKNKKEHVLICGWKPDLEAIVSGILAANPDLLPSDLVLVNQAGEEQLFPVLSSPAFRGINYVSGDLTDEDTLDRAGIRTADRVLILSDRSRPGSNIEQDSRTVLAVLLIKKLNRKAYVAAELADEKFRRHLENEHCDEIILTAEHERRLIVSASSGTGMNHVLETMLGASGGLSVSDIPEDRRNLTFGALAEYYREREDGILIGLLENTGNFYLRKQEALGEAQKNPDIEEIVSDLKKVKEMKSNRTVLAPGASYAVKTHAKAILIRQTGAQGGL